MPLACAISFQAYCHACKAWQGIAGTFSTADDAAMMHRAQCPHGIAGYVTVHGVCPNCEQGRTDFHRQAWRAVNKDNVNTWDCLNRCAIRGFAPLSGKLTNSL